MTDGILRFLQKTVDGDRLSGTPQKLPSHSLLMYVRGGECNGMFLRGDAPHQESSFHAMISSFPDFITFVRH